MKSDNGRILHVLVALSLLFLSLIGYLLCFPLFWSGDYTDSVYDPRTRAEEERILRGSFYDRKGMRLAYSERAEDGTQVRKYPHGNSYAHVIGYCSPIYGRSGMELIYNAELAGKSFFSNPFSDADTEPMYGADVYTTLDHRLQEKAEMLLRGKEGAIVVIDPKSGAVRAMVSAPSFSPVSKDLEENWGTLCTDSTSPLLNRAVQGKYAPGSVFKIITLSGAIEGGMEGELFEDTGVYTANGKEIRNAGDKIYGTLTLKDAFARSANTVFADIAVRLGEDNMKKLSRRFGLDSDFPLEIPTAISSGGENLSDPASLAAFGIGQDTLSVTPLFLALVAGAVANDGVMMTPYITDQITVRGFSVMRHSAKAHQTVMKESTARTIREYMRAVVENGTGTSANSKHAVVYGKTGTAENETDKTHAWFVGFAEKENKESIAFAVLWAYSGKTGGDVCAPMAKELVDTWFLE
ncbi:MAG: penicillin-binding protein 2 [Clostridia bacterium]|nr:penicillin-binding protein 2 [Clostridia bacterium]